MLRRRTKISLLLTGLIFAGVFGTLVFVDSEPTKAADFTYTAQAPAPDVSDANPGDGICDSGLGVCNFRAAVEEANADGGSSEIVFDGGGSHIVSSDVTVTQPITITGPEDEIVYLNGSAQYSPLILQAGSSGSSISNLTLTNSGDQSCICASDISPTPNNITINNTMFDCPLVIGGNAWTVSNNTFTTQNGLISSTDGTVYSFITIDNNTFDCQDIPVDSEDEGIIDLSSSDNNSNIQITDNTITDCNTSGINIHGSSFGITGNQLDNVGESDFPAIWVIAYGSNNFDISNNTINNSREGAILINNRTSPLNNIDILSNTLSNNNQGIIIISDLGTDLTIYDLQINNNTITQADENSYGIVLYAWTEAKITLIDSNFENNTISGGGNSILLTSIDDGTSLTIEDNTFSGGENQNGNVHLSTIANGGITFNNNTSENAETYGLHLSNCQGPFTISNNTFSNNGSSGIRIYSSNNNYPNNVSISDNTFEDNTDYGIDICGGTDYNIEQNTFNNNDDDAIAIQAGDGFEVTNNSFSGNDGDLLVHGTTSNINFTANTISSSVQDTYASVMFYAGGSDNNVSNNSFSNIPGNVISILTAENPIAFSNNTFDNCANTIATGFFVEPFSITYDGTTYDDGTGGDGSIWFYNDGELYEIGATTNATPVVDGVNNFNLALVYTDIPPASTEIIGIFFFRDDQISNENDAQVVLLALLEEAGAETVEIDYWQDDIWIANGATADYNWNQESDEISTLAAPALEYVTNKNLNYVYAVYTSDNTFTNETITNSGQGFVFRGNNNHVIDSNINTTDSSVTSKTDVTNYLDNTAFNSHDVQMGTVDVNYDARIHLFDNDGNNLENATIAASYNPTVNLGATDENGLTNYQSLDAALITASGMTENTHTISATYNGETKNIFSTINEPNQEIDFNYTSSTTNTNTNVNSNANVPYIYVNYNTNTPVGDVNENINTNANTNQGTNTNLNTNNIVINNRNLGGEGEDLPTIEQPTGEDLVLEGRTTPNTRVVITIVLENGEVIQIETISDSEGNWKIVFDKSKLPEGSHTIYIQTEIDGVLSEMAELAKLVIQGERKLSTQWLVLIIILVMVVIAVLTIVLYYLNRRKKKTIA